MPSRNLFLIALAVATALKVGLVLSGLVDGSLLSDDAFYYFTIAHNLAEGAGPTFDGLTPTNGFQPLWQLMLVPIFALVDGLWAPVRAALLLCILLDGISAWIFHGLLRPVLSERRAALAAAGLLLFPLSFVLGLRGMEASLSLLCILLTWRTVLRMQSSPRDFLLLGVLVGLTGWARLDNLASVGVAVAASLWMLGANSIPRLQRIRRIVAVGMAALVVISPLLLWNLVEFGHFLPVSARVKRMAPKLFGHLSADFSSVSSSLDTVITALAAPVLIPLRFVVGEEFQPGNWYVPAAFLLLLGGGFLAARGIQQIRRRGEGKFLVFPLAYVLVHVLLFGLWFRSYVTWYALPTLAFLAILVAEGLPGNSRGRAGRWTLGIIVGLSLLVSARFATRLDHSPQKPERYYAETLIKIRNSSPQTYRFGAFDAGAIGYLCTQIEGKTVVNLDGLVNNEAFEAVLADRYPEYVAETVDIFLQPRERTRLFLDEAGFARLQRLLHQRREGSSP